MKIYVDLDHVDITEYTQIESGEYNTNKINFIFTPEYKDLVKVAIFGCKLDTDEPKFYKIYLSDDSCYLPSEVTSASDVISIGVYAFNVDNGELKLRYSPTPVKTIVYEGSFREEAENASSPTPTEIEQIMSRIISLEDITSDLNTRVEALENKACDVDSIKEDVETLKSDIENISGRLDTVESDIDDLEGDIANTYSKTEVDTLLGSKVDTTTYESSQAAQDEKIAKAELILSQLPKVTGEGTNFSLSPTIEYDLEVGYKGDTIQATTTYLDTGTWEEGEIDSRTGVNVYSTSNVRTADYISVKPNVLFNISRSIYNSYMSLRFYDTSKTYLGNQQTSGMITSNMSDGRMGANVSSMTMTITNTNVAYMRIQDKSNNLSTVYTISTTSPSPSYPSDIQVVTGTQEVEICGKNLFDNNNPVFISSSNMTVTPITNGVNISVSVATGFVLYKVGKMKDVVGKTFTLSTTTTSEVIKNSRFVYCDEDGSNRTNLGNELSGSTSLSTTIPSGDYGEKILCARLYVTRPSGQTTYAIDINNVQVELGSTATSFSPYTSESYTLHLGDEELAKIGSYQDKIYFDNGKWYLRKEIGKKIFDGTEYWGQYVNDNLGYHTGIANDFKYGFYEGYCDYFTFQNNSSTWTSHGKCGIGSSRVFWLLHTDSNINTVDKFKTWLSTHNMTIRYVLNAPITTEITNTTLLQDLNYIKEHIKSFSDTTNISTSGNLPLIITASALKQLS